MASYPIINENGVDYYAVPTTFTYFGTNYLITYTVFYYIYKNPVTLEKEVLDENNNIVLDESGNPVTEYVPSKLEMRKEPIEYLEVTGTRVVKILSGTEHWLIKKPDSFNASVEEFQIGSTNQIFSQGNLPFIAQRVGDYLEQFVRTTTSGGTTTDDRQERRLGTRTKILNLLNQKYG